RNAEWNYLFGAVLLRQGETDKAVLYFGIAARQKPACAQYRTAFISAEAIRDRKRSAFQRIAEALFSARRKQG
ncbi:MAG: hypothetical protein GX580_13120, partial [Candidatus Hydrogenedens sp.]|nr:hypothetical protein [Candidatus Hydrogenedens sp.]